MRKISYLILLGTLISLASCKENNESSKNQTSVDSSNITSSFILSSTSITVNDSSNSSSFFDSNAKDPLFDKDMYYEETKEIECYYLEEVNGRSLFMHQKGFFTLDKKSDLLVGSLYKVEFEIPQQVLFNSMSATNLTSEYQVNLLETFYDPNYINIPFVYSVEVYDGMPSFDEDGNQIEGDISFLDYNNFIEHLKLANDASEEDLINALNKIPYMSEYDYKRIKDSYLDTYLFKEDEEEQINLVDNKTLYAYLPFIIMAL